MMWPAQRIFTKVQDDGAVTHNYVVPRQWELMPAVAHASASLKCDYSFDEVLLKMVEDGLPTGFTPTSVYVDGNGEIHAPPQHQRFFAAPRERDPEEVAGEVLDSIIGFLERNALGCERAVEKRVRAIRNGAVVLKGGGDCPVRVGHLHRYFMSGDFLPFLNECTVRDECASMPNVFVDIENDQNHKFLGGLIDAHQKNLIRVVAVTQAAAHAFPAPAKSEVRVGRFFKKCSAPPLYARTLSAPIVSHGAVCAVLERIYRREVGFWHMCDAQRVDDAFKYISSDMIGELWDAHCKDLRRFRPWNRMRWGERKKAVKFMCTQLKSRWVELARKKIQNFPWMNRRYWKEQTPRPTKECSPESLNFAQICVAKERLHPLKQVNPNVFSVLVTDRRARVKYTAEELDCFTEQLRCHLFFPLSLKKKTDDRMGLAARLILGMRPLMRLLYAWDFTTAPPFAQKCLALMQSYCQDRAAEKEEEIKQYEEKKEDYGREIRECKRHVSEWEQKEAEYSALAKWSIPADKWAVFEQPSVPLRGDETIEIVERNNILVAKIESRPAKRQKRD